MQKYLREFTERVIIAVRAGEIEKQAIIDELQELIDSKPENAADEMALYLEFLIKVAKGEPYDDIWNRLDKELQDIFGMAIQKFKGNDIMKNLEEFTQKAISAVNADDTLRSETIRELKAVLSNKPEGGSESVEKYIEFLIEVAEGKNPQHLISGLDKNLLGIYTGMVKSHVESDMMKFFSLLTQEAFDAVDSKEAKNSILSKLSELLSGEEPPPREIKDYLLLLMAVAKDEDYSIIKEAIVPDLLDIFNRYDKS